jgi:hypothetical protein
MPNLSLRISEADEENLDRLVVAVRAYYSHMADTLPVAAQMARETTRSSALRDLLLAWKRGEANTLFKCDLTADIND